MIVRIRHPFTIGLLAGAGWIAGQRLMALIERPADGLYVQWLAYINGPMKDFF